MRVDLPSGTVTFLFTDVEGSTRLLHELGAEAYAEALAEHRRLIREACSRSGGVEVDTQGDALFFAFPTARGAIAAAGEMTEALASGPIQVRVGLHTGTPLLTEEGYVGGDVHFAARVAASGHGGQVVVSSGTEALFLPSDKVSQGISLLDLGEHRLKDIEGSVSIFQLGDRRFPPLKTISNTNLPRPASSFVGREAELAEVLSRIEGGARLVTLTGPGGSGKTRLALEAASTLVPAYKAGVFWIGLVSLRDPALVTETISQTLGAKDGLAEHIAEREMLLLLDNLEQVIEAAPELPNLLASCPNLTLLVTSRELLRVQGEVEYAVPPLAEPEAVSLFCERAQLETSDEIAELCSRLDNLPLAVELAAARVKVLSPTQILDRLSQRLDLLKGGRDADPRQQTLRATIEWSNDLLSAEEKQLFARLSVFAGGYTLEAAKEACDADLDTLQSLVEKSLLRHSGERFWMLETIREYAAERLEESDETEELGRRHAAHFTAIAEAADEEWWTDRQKEWLDRLEPERENLRGAAAWTRRTADTETALRLAVAVSRFWLVRGPLPEGLRWLEEAIDAGRAESSRLRARALRRMAGFGLRLGEPARARRAAEESLALYREIGDEAGIAGAHHDLAEALSHLGEVGAAGSHFDEAVALLRRCGTDRNMGRALLSMGYLELEQRRYDRAAELFEEGLDRMRRTGISGEVAYALVNLASARLAQGRLREADAQLRESFALCRGLQDGVGGAYAIEAIAVLAARLSEHERAAALFGAAQRLFEENGAAMQPFELNLHDETTVGVQRILGADSFEAAWARGAELTNEEVAAVVGVVGTSGEGSDDAVSADAPLD